MRFLSLCVSHFYSFIYLTTLIHHSTPKTLREIHPRSEDTKSEQFVPLEHKTIQKMPQPKHFDRDAPRYRDYSPSSSSSYLGDPYDRPSRAVQPYSNNRQRDSRALQPYTNGSRSGYASPRSGPVRRRSDGSLKSSRRDQAGVWFKDHGAELIGAAAGGLAGRKKGDDPLTTASGAAVGAIGGKVLDHQYRKWNDRREDKKVGRDVRGGGRRREYDEDDYALAPRYSRSLDRRGRSVSRGRDRSPQNWREVGRQLMRSLSRKGERGRNGY